MHPVSYWVKMIVLRDQSSVSGAQRKRKAVVREEPFDPLEYEPFTGKRVDMYVDWSEDELRLCAQCVCFRWVAHPDSSGGRCQGDGLECWDIVAEMVEENGDLCSIILCKQCYDQRREGRNELAANQRAVEAVGADEM